MTMNVLFLTLHSFETIQVRTLFTDLLREFVKNGHKVYVISPTERREKQKTHLIVEDNALAKTAFSDPSTIMIPNNGLIIAIPNDTRTTFL